MTGSNQIPPEQTAPKKVSKKSALKKREITDPLLHKVVMALTVATLRSSGFAPPLRLRKIALDDLNRQFKAKIVSEGDEVLIFIEEAGS